MESQTQTTTVPPVSSTASSGTAKPGNETTPNAKTSNGNRIVEENLLADGSLPSPKPAPNELKQPEDPQSLEDRMASEEEHEENKKQWEAYNDSDWANYVALKEEVESVNPDGFVKPGESEEDERPLRNILANMSFQNGHMVNEHLLSQLRIVFETDADQTKRDEGYKCRFSPNVVTRHTTDNDRSRKCCFGGKKP
jgi:hypothetical protein